MNSSGCLLNPASERVSDMARRPSADETMDFVLWQAHSGDIHVVSQTVDGKCSHVVHRRPFCLDGDAREELCEGGHPTCSPYRGLTESEREEGYVPYGCRRYLECRGRFRVVRQWVGKIREGLAGFNLPRRCLF